MTQSSNTTPHWVKDNPVVLTILNKFIDRVESDQGLKMSIGPKPSQTPELYNFDHGDPEELWRLILSKLQNEFAIVDVHVKSKLGTTDQPYHGAKLIFQAEREALVREWLNRPVRQSYPQAWQIAIRKHGDVFPNPDAFIKPIHLPGKTAAQVVEGMVRVANELEQLEKAQSSLSLRTLSARCFWGNSKVLDSRQALLEAAFPSAAARIQARPILMSVYIPADMTCAVFIENFASFLSTVTALKESPFKNNVAAIYSAGFLGSAERIRHSGNAQFVLVNQVDPVAHQLFQQWWQDESNDSIPCYFWGDLDFGGMAILKVMRNKFKGMQCWQGAYKHTIKYHQLGVRHLAEEAKKERQEDPCSTGCDYADQTLLPLMRMSNEFTDQEVVCEHEIGTVISELFEYASR